MSKTWEIDLQRGEWFEETIVYPWLLSNRPDYWITECRNHNKHIKGGPRLTKLDKNLVLPDFRLDNPIDNTSGWIDAKLKAKPFKLRDYKNELFHSIDPRAHEEYTKVISTFPNMKFEIFLGCRKSKTLYMFDFKMTKPVWFWFNNKFVRCGRNNTPCYPLSSMTVLGSWDITGLPK